MADARPSGSVDPSRLTIADPPAVDPRIARDWERLRLLRPSRRERALDALLSRTRDY